MVHGTHDVETPADLGRDEAVQRVAHRAAPEQIGVPAADPAGARAAKREADAAILDQPVDLVEERRNLLHFADDDETSPRTLELFPEQSRLS